MTILQGTMQDGTVLPVQVDAQGRLVAEGLQGIQGPKGDTGPMGPAGPTGPAGSTATPVGDLLFRSSTWVTSTSAPSLWHIPTDVLLEDYAEVTVRISKAAFGSGNMNLGLKLFSDAGLTIGNNWKVGKPQLVAQTYNGSTLQTVYANDFSSYGVGGLDADWVASLRLVRYRPTLWTAEGLQVSVRATSPVLITGRYMGQLDVRPGCRFALCQLDAAGVVVPGSDLSHLGTEVSVYGVLAAAATGGGSPV